MQICQRLKKSWSFTKSKAEAHFHNETAGKTSWGERRKSELKHQIASGRWLQANLMPLWGSSVLICVRLNDLQHVLNRTNRKKKHSEYQTLWTREQGQAGISERDNNIRPVTWKNRDITWTVLRWTDIINMARQTHLLEGRNLTAIPSSDYRLILVRRARDRTIPYNDCIKLG